MISVYKGNILWLISRASNNFAQNLPFFQYSGGMTFLECYFTDTGTYIESHLSQLAYSGE